MELWELVARESIRDLVARYNALGDAGRFEEMAKVFAPDAVMELVSGDGGVRRFEGIDAITTVFTGTKATWDAAAAGRRADGPADDSADSPGDRPIRHHVRHFVATHQIDVDDRAHARGRSYFLVLMGHGIDHWGRYVDAYETRDGQWRIVRRRALTDGRTADGPPS